MPTIMELKTTHIKLLLKCKELLTSYIMKILVLLFIGTCVLVSSNMLYAQVPPNSKLVGDMNELDEAKKEITHLIKEIEQLRKERDAYRKDIEARESQVSAELKVLSVQLSKEIKNDFYESVSKFFWIVGILVIIATAGGFWKLSDLITNRINTKVDEKEKDIQKLKDSVLDALVDFKMQASAAIKEVSERRKTVVLESETAISEIRSKVLFVKQELDASGKMIISPCPPEKDPWFGELTPGVIGIAGSSFDESAGSDALVSGIYMGAFSHFFQKALRDKNADKDGDGRVSLIEAIEETCKALKKSGYSQKPMIVGADQNLALFSIKKVPKAEKFPGKILALLIGINIYEMGSNLSGPVNDVLGFKKLLENRNYLLVKDVIIHILCDNEATLSNIQNKLIWLQNNSTSEDVVIFYYSGHQTKLSLNTETVKILIPHDFKDKEERFLAFPTIVKELGQLSARHKLVIVDG